MGVKWQNSGQNAGIVTLAHCSCTDLQGLLVVKEKLRPPPACLSPYLGVLATLVELGQCQQRFCRDIFIKDSEDDGWQGREEEVEEYHLPVIDHGGAREATEELVPEEQVDVALQAESVAL